ncbi:hypothetical protein [Kitasatospora purpeofusca]|uniref:hypothetical protein n=1 Tax=Kitasatospora purpeofusca TaxID=67352 RepID=UPI0036D42B5D
MAKKLLPGNNWAVGVQKVHVGDKFAPDSPTLVDESSKGVEGVELLIELSNDLAVFDDGSRRFIAVTDSQGKIPMHVIQVIGTESQDDPHKGYFMLTAAMLAKPQIEGVTGSFHIDQP